MDVLCRCMTNLMVTRGHVVNRQWALPISEAACESDAALPKKMCRCTAPVNYANSAIACHNQQLAICTPAATADLALYRRCRTECGGQSCPAFMLGLGLAVDKVDGFTAWCGQRQLPVGGAPRKGRCSCSTSNHVGAAHRGRARSRQQAFSVITSLHGQSCAIAETHTSRSVTECVGARSFLAQFCPVHRERFVQDRCCLQAFHHVRAYRLLSLATQDAQVSGVTFDTLVSLES